jgi:hypothetical protein
MYPYNRLIVRRSWYLSTIDSSLYPKHSGDERRNKGKGRSSMQGQSSGSEPVHGDGFKYEEAMVMPNKIAAWAFSFSCFAFFAFFFTSRLVSVSSEEMVSS